MSNTHGFPDLLKEAESIHYDLLPACITATSGLTIPGSGLTLTAVSAQGYVRRGSDLLFVDQPAVSVTVSSTAGNHWLALTVDTWSTISGWTRRAGSHFVEQANATQPTAPDGTQLVAQVVVTGANVTTVTPILSPPLSRQNANAVAITGGAISVPRFGVNVAAPGTDGSSQFMGPIGVGVAPDPALSFKVAYKSRFSDLLGIGMDPTYALDVTGQTRVSGSVGIGRVPASNIQVNVSYTSTPGNYGSMYWPLSGGAATPLIFTRWDGGVFTGSITTTDTSTAYNTSSDARLKRSIQALPGGVEALRALKPVSFIWNSTDERDIGFLAHELMTVAPNAVTGLPDDVHPDGTIKPQQVDQSKLIPILTAALKDIMVQVEALTARMATLEEQLGL